MAEYIKRDYAAQAIEGYLCYQCKYETDSIQCNNCPYLDGTEILSTLPSENVQPVIHAAWIETTPNDYYEWFKCSNCKYTDTKKFNYCPKCGAKMDC